MPPCRSAVPPHPSYLIPHHLTLQVPGEVAVLGEVIIAASCGWLKNLRSDPYHPTHAGGVAHKPCAARRVAIRASGCDEPTSFFHDSTVARLHTPQTLPERTGPAFGLQLVRLVTDGGCLVGMTLGGSCYVWMLDDAACIAVLPNDSPSLPLPCLHSACDRLGQRTGQRTARCSLLLINAGDGHLRLMSLNDSLLPAQSTVSEGLQEAQLPSPRRPRPGVDSQSLGGYYSQLEESAICSQMSDGSPSQRAQGFRY